MSAPPEPAAGPAAMPVDRLNPRLRSHLGSIAKAVSWRVTAGIDTFIISYIVTGSVKGAGSIAAFELVTKIGLYWAHERAWLRLERWHRLFGGRPRPTPVGE